MMSKRLSRFLAAGWAALVLACVPAAVATAGETGRKVVIAAFGLFGDQSVFESEAKGAADIAAKRFGGAPVIVRANTRNRGDATVGTLAATLDSAAKDMDPENDILLLILTSHGSHGGLAVKAGATEETLSPWLLSATLRYTGVRHRIVIISACYSGIFLPLATADTLVITGRRCRSSVVRVPGRRAVDLFRRRLLQHRDAPGATLREAFNLARELVRKRELGDGFAPSNPQIAGGENIEPLLASMATAAPQPVSTPSAAAPPRGASRRSGGAAIRPATAVTP